MSDQPTDAEALRQAIRQFIAEVTPAIIAKKQAKTCDVSLPDNPSQTQSETASS